MYTCPSRDVTLKAGRTFEAANAAAITEGIDDKSGLKSLIPDTMTEYPKLVGDYLGTAIRYMELEEFPKDIDYERYINESKQILEDIGYPEI